MNGNVRPIGVAVALLGMISVLGCEDTAAKQRDEVQKSLSRINLDLQVAMASAGATGDESSVAKLNKVIADLQGVNGGEAWQDASKAMLSATASRELSDVHITEVERLEARHRDARQAIRENLNA